MISFTKIQIQDELTIDGSGVGFNGGLIVRPVDFVTLGLSYKSPTYYSLNDESGFTFATDWNENYSYYNGTNSEGDSVFYDMGSYKETSDLTMSQYNLKTPGKPLWEPPFSGQSWFHFRGCGVCGLYQEPAEIQ